MIKMEIMTAEQAAEAAKGLTFETVWVALMEMKESLKESQMESQKRIEESQRRTDKIIAESQKKVEESQKKTETIIAESQKNTNKIIAESQKNTDKILADLSRNIGGLGNFIGRFTESMFSAELWEKFNKLGYTFTKQAPHMKFYDNGKVLAEVDFFLENGIYAMPVEIKAELSNGNVDDHLERIGKIREYMDERNDKRKLIGAVAGGIVQESVLRYAQKKGLFVIVQTGDSVAIAAMPKGFKAREW